MELTEEHTHISRDVLKNHGNMSSPTVLFVLEEFMKVQHKNEELGLLVALGPGFCGEAILLNWRD